MTPELLKGLRMLGNIGRVFNVKKLAEIKARYEDHDYVKGVLKTLHASFRGIDHQIDTYFKVPRGRLKFREGNIENYLIYYERKETKDIKQSHVILYPLKPNSSLKDILTRVLEPLVIVYKRREIYYVDNVKVHLDSVKDLGRFVEVEAHDEQNITPSDKLFKQVKHYIKLFDIPPKELVDASYADLLLQQFRT